MKLTAEQLQKVRDPMTKDVLEDASDDTPLRVVMTLEPESPEQKTEQVEDVENEEPPVSRTEMRRRLIEQKSRDQRAQLQPIIDELTAQSLDVKGGQLRTVVVDGLACDILKGIGVPGVSKVRVDRKIK